MGMMSDINDDSLDSEDGEMSSSRASSPAPELLEKYKTLMSSILDTTSIPSHKAQEADMDSDNGAAEEKKGMTKAEKQNAKKKRRKERERAARIAQVTSEAKAGQAVETNGTVAAFRLFSSTPIRPIDYGEKAEVYDIPLNPRHQPMPEVEKERRRKAAIQAAVDYPNLGGPSHVHARWSRPALQTRLVQSSVQNLEQILILAIDQPISRKALHQFAKPLNVSTIRTQTGRHHRPRRRPREHPYPAYWLPPSDIGGKSAGYALGYPISAYPL